jgi:uncharacterized protein YaiI (UPF0178 family)
MTLWLDADATRATWKEICLRAAERLRLATVLVANQRVPLPPGIAAYVTAVRVAGGPDVADRYIVDHAAAGDVAVTADIPLAALLVPLGVAVIDPRGEEYTRESIGERLSVRDFLDGLRGAGVDTGGTPRTGAGQAGVRERTRPRPHAGAPAPVTGRECASAGNPAGSRRADRSSAPGETRRTPVRRRRTRRTMPVARRRTWWRRRRLPADGLPPSAPGLMAIRRALGPLALAATLGSSALHAQGALRPAPSGRATTEVVLTLVDTAARAAAQPSRIRIDYGQPHLRGRRLHTDSLVPYDQVWRTGANEATTLTTDVDLVIGGARVPRGRYVLQTVPGGPGGSSSSRRSPRRGRRRPARRRRRGVRRSPRATSRASTCAAARSPRRSRASRSG